LATPGVTPESEEAQVPLSEHEHRLLEQIEQALYAEDPKFAIIRAGIALVAGLGVLLAGVVTKLVWLGVIGFVLMLVAASFAVASWQRMAGPRRAASQVKPATSTAAKRSVVQRLEDRWQRRQEDR
jgi:UPF0716 family protein affecting phage T7 exclusion